MKAALNYFTLPIDNSALSLRTAYGRREVVRALVQAVSALLVLFVSVAGILAISAAGLTILLSAILYLLLGIVAVPLLVFFGVLWIFPSQD